MPTLSPPLPKKWLPRNRPRKPLINQSKEEGREGGGRARDKGLFRPWFPVKKGGEKKQGQIFVEKIAVILNNQTCAFAKLQFGE